MIAARQRVRLSLALAGICVGGWLLGVVLARIGQPPIPFAAQMRAASESDRPLPMLYQIEQHAARQGWSAEDALRAGRAWLSMGSPLNAIPYLERARDQAAARRSLVEAYTAVQDWAGAEAVLRDVLAEDSAGATWAALQLALIRIAADPSEARMLLERAAHDPAYTRFAGETMALLGSTSNPVRIGLALARAGWWAYAEHALEYAPDDPLALALIGLARAMQDRPAGAHLDAAVRLAPADASVHLIAGLALRQLGQVDRSLEMLIIAAALAPDQALMYAELGTAYQLTGDLIAAERWLSMAVTLSGNAPIFVERMAALRDQETGLIDALSLLLDGG
jgi:tetratricopeptide (TPR) repeat protein